MMWGAFTWSEHEARRLLLRFSIAALMRVSTGNARMRFAPHIDRQINGSYRVGARINWVR